MLTSSPHVIKLESICKHYRSSAFTKRSILSIYFDAFRLAAPRKSLDSDGHHSLLDVSLTIDKGERVSLVGRNGAGKSSLLRVINRSLMPSSGSVQTSGEITSLINIGVGFSTDATGRENVKRSLRLVSGYTSSELEIAVEEIRAWCELGDFFDKPIKTYSLGMLGRLQFACATQVNPSILIIDEVLGAGDAYFVSKCSERVKSIVDKGSSLVLVSHSMQQCLELTERAIWLDEGRIVMDSRTDRVVKEYEKYIAKKKRDPMLTARAYINQPSQNSLTLDDEDKPGGNPGVFKGNSGSTSVHEKLNHALPLYCDSQASTDGWHFDKAAELYKDNIFQYYIAPDTFDFVHPTGISRWETTTGIKVVAYSSFQNGLKTNDWDPYHDGYIAIKIQNSTDAAVKALAGVVLQSYSRDNLLKIWSPCLDIDPNSASDFLLKIKSGFLINVNLVVGISLHEFCDLSQINNSRRYDLLSESFVLNVSAPQSRQSYLSRIAVPCSWVANSAGL